MTKTKQCNACGDHKPVSEFYKDSKTHDQLTSRCTPCVRAKRRSNLTISRANRQRKYSRTGNRMCRVCKVEKPVDEFPANYNDKGYDSVVTRCKKCKSLAYRMDTYELTEDEWNAMIAKQNGQCAICHRVRTLHIDHSHDTGEVRGLLCFNCNTAIGKLEDNVVWLQNAVTYLS